MLADRTVKVVNHLYEKQARCDSPIGGLRLKRDVSSRSVWVPRAPEPNQRLHCKLERRYYYYVLYLLYT